MCRITMIFGTLKDRGLVINMFASNNNYLQKHLTKWFEALSKKDDAFLTENMKILYCSDYPITFEF